MHTAIRAVVMSTSVLLLSSWLPAAPVPAQIATAKKVFLANAGNDSYMTTADTSRLFDSFYLALKDWGRFELVPTAGQADLIVEVYVTDEVFQSNEGPRANIRLNTTLVDPATQTPIWKFTERPDNSSLKNFDKAGQALVDDFKNLVTRALAATTAVPH